MENKEEKKKEEKKIEIGQETLNILNTTRKWTMFLAILGFIGIGVLLGAGVVTGLFLTVFNTTETNLGFPESIIFVIVIFLALVYFFPVLYLFRFSKNISEAVRTYDKTKLHEAFRNLKAYYLYIGVLIIVFLALYIIFFIALGASAPFIEDLVLVK
jgi:MFS family permease